MSHLLAGRQPILEALKAGTPLEEIVLLRGVRGKAIEEILRLAASSHIPVKEVDQQHFQRLAVDVTTQGLVALLPARKVVDLAQVIEYSRSRESPGFILIGDQIEDPQNLGALLRTAECAGVHGVVIPRHHAAPLTAAVAKASAGAIEHLLVAQVTNVVNAIEELKQAEYWVVGLSAEGDRRYDEVDYSMPVALVVGNEGRGIRRLVKEHCDHLVKIPLLGRVDSLNASVAGALVMYEVVRQRRRGAAKGG